MTRDSRILGDREVDSGIAVISEAVAARMTATGLRGSDLRERLHVAPYVKDAVRVRCGAEAASTTLRTSAFPRLGPVDVVVRPERVLMELKWSYAGKGKVFESLWDAIKLAILGAERAYDHLYILTGASHVEWKTGDCTDLFETGRFDPLEMWSRILEPRGPNRGTTVGRDLVIGGRGAQPVRGPTELEVQRLGEWSVAGDFELRLARVKPSSKLRTWPQIPYPVIPP